MYYDISATGRCPTHFSRFRVIPRPIEYSKDIPRRVPSFKPSVYAGISPDTFRKPVQASENTMLVHWDRCSARPSTKCADIHMAVSTLFANGNSRSIEHFWPPRAKWGSQGFCCT